MVSFGLPPGPGWLADDANVRFAFADGKKGESSGGVDRVFFLPGDGRLAFIATRGSKRTMVVRRRAGCVE